MYANLRVSVDDGEPVFAHEVEITSEQVIVHLDDNDGESSYAEPAGTQEIPRDGHTVSIAANF